ncbi:MAG: sugar phosphate isomerase/epimerase [Clostridia bacterium]|nr:sugar phosphate isomerase/epimerase [Clostridia bacterium]
MNIGISSSCFYPLETERSLRRVGEAGAKTTEIFFNTPSELTGDLLHELCAIRDHYGMTVSSVHPFQSFAEGYWLFSEYRRRFTDALDLYAPLFAAAAVLGAKFAVFHGAKKLVIDDTEYAERFFHLNERAKQFGVIAAHENVVHYVGETPAFMVRLYELLGDEFHMVLDLKQARRAGEDPFVFLSRLKQRIIHLHVSDGTPDADCLPPGEGAFDFRRLKAALDDLGYDGALMIELYRDNFRHDAQLTKAKQFLEAIWTE